MKMVASLRADNEISGAMSEREKRLHAGRINRSCRATRLKEPIAPCATCAGGRNGTD